MTKNQMEEKIDKVINHAGEEEKEEILQNFEVFKNFLGDQVHRGEKIGLNDEQIAQGAQKIGDYLAKREKPRNREEYLLQEMWKVADKDQRHSMAHVLVNLARTTN